LSEPNEVDVTLVLPIPRILDEASSEILQMSDELRRLGKTHEFLVIVDRTSGSPRDWRAPAGRGVVLLEAGGVINESAALSLGFQHARGKLVVTLTRFPQVEPAALAPAMQAIEQDRADMVVGWRYPRQGSLANRLQSSVYHRLVWWLTGTEFHDFGCGFRVMRRAVARELDLYGSLHRFVPLLAEERGLRVMEVQVPQIRGDRPRRIHGIPTLSAGLLDGLTILFLTKFTRRPLRFFGVIGMSVGVAGSAILVYLAFYRLLGYGAIADRPLLLLGVLLTVLGVQSISIGLLGEIIIFTHARRLRSYRVLREVSFRADGGASTWSAEAVAGSDQTADERADERARIGAS
jgi:hypothetical protein